jgi:hypothetical protein
MRLLDRWQAYTKLDRAIIELRSALDAESRTSAQPAAVASAMSASQGGRTQAGATAPPRAGVPFHRYNDCAKLRARWQNLELCYLFFHPEGAPQPQFLNTKPKQCKTAGPNCEYKFYACPHNAPRNEQYRQRK